jgi:hypothetical protein
MKEPPASQKESCEKSETVSEVLKRVAKEGSKHCETKEK